MVKIGWRIRDDLGDIDELSKSISMIGQLTPITITIDRNDEYVLIAGMRRLTACKKLGVGVKAIIVEVEDELVELDMQLAENIRRKDFDQIELGKGLRRRKEIYQSIFPETKKGGRRSKNDKSVRPKERFALMTSRELGISEATVSNLIQLGEVIDNKENEEEIRSAKNSRERNKIAMRLLRELRQQRKIEKLEDRARERNNENQIKFENVEAKINIHMKDNNIFFDESEKEQYDLIITDPPYETQRQSLISHIHRGDITSDFGDWNKLDIGWVLKALPLLTEDGQILSFCPLEAISDYKTIFQSIGLIYRGAIVWHKTNPGTAHRPVYLSSVEAIVWATKGDKYYFRPWSNAGSYEAHNMIEGPICGGGERLDHPTQKPEWIIDKLLERHASLSSHVLDPFAGVGTILAVCKKRNISATGVESDPDFCGQALIRIKSI